MKNKKDKLLILGFDGTSPDLLSKWVSEGKLPAIAALIEKGAWGPLRSVPNMYSPPAWTSFSTGKNPGKHGIFRFTERNFDSYRYVFVSGAHRRAETFWELLCGEHTGCVIGVPMTYPVQEINGCMVAGFDAPSSDSEGVCFPKDLIDQIKAQTGSYQLTPSFANLLRRGARWDQAAKKLIDNMELRYRNIEYVMGQYDWDLFVAVFGETDLAHHFFWKFIDPSHPDYDEHEASKYGDTILKIYQTMDGIIGRIAEKNDDATIMIMSDHGGGLNPRGEELLADWLDGVGLLKRKKASWSQPVQKFKSGINSLVGWAYRLALKTLSSSLKMRMAGALPRLRAAVSSAMQLGDIDWSRTKAYSDGAQDDIWINLSGRDPEGIVGEEEYDSLCEFICSELRDAVDLVTGKPIVDAVYRRNDIYDGDFVELAADISVRWRTDQVINGIKSKSSPAGMKAHKWSWPAEINTGAHSLDGIFIAAGPQIAKNIALKDATIMDIAPTALYLFDEVVPEEMDGQVLSSIFEPEYISQRPPRYGSGDDFAKEKKQDVYSEDDNAIIEQRLRDLGYI